MSKYIKFNEKGCPIEQIENECDLSQMVLNDAVWYSVPDDYDFCQNRFRFVLVNGELQENNENQALNFQATLARQEQSQKIEELMQQKEDEIDAYFKKYAMTFKVRQGDYSIKKYKDELVGLLADKILSTAPTHTLIMFDSAGVKASFDLPKAFFQQVMDLVSAKAAPLYNIKTEVVAKLTALTNADDIAKFDPSVVLEDGSFLPNVVSEIILG